MKLILVALAILPISTNTIKLTILIWFFAAYALVLYNRKPFTNKQLNFFDTKSGITYVITLFAGYFALQNLIALNKEFNDQFKGEIMKKFIYAALAIRKSLFQVFIVFV